MGGLGQAYRNFLSLVRGTPPRPPSLHLLCLVSQCPEQGEPWILGADLLLRDFLHLLNLGSTVLLTWAEHPQDLSPGKDPRTLSLDSSIHQSLRSTGTVFQSLSSWRVVTNIQVDPQTLVMGNLVHQQMWGLFFCAFWEDVPSPAVPCVWEDKELPGAGGVGMHQ